MQPDDTMERINSILAHAWMVRTFLKHADEIQEDEELLQVHRMIFDYIRALEPSYQRRDAVDYVRRAKGKLPKLRRVAELLAGEYRRVSDHTNFVMASASLTACVRDIEAALADVESSAGVNPAARGEATPTMRKDELDEP